MLANRKPVYSIISIVVVVALIIVISFFEKIEYSFENNFLLVHTSVWSDIAIDVDQIESVRLRNDINVGKRVGGYGSSKIGVGNFKNEEYGKYTLYHYNSSNCLVEIKKYDGSVIVLGGIDDTVAENLYNSLTLVYKK